jgi:predicted esterase
MLFEMLTGRLPFEGASATAILLSIATEAAPPIRTLRSDTPPEFGSLIDRALVKDPDARALTPRDAADVMAGYHAPITVMRVSAWRHALQRPSVAVLLIAAVLIGAAAVWSVGRSVLDQRWARYTALPEIARLADQQDFVRAVELAMRAQPLLGDRAELDALWPRIARVTTIESDPTDATVSYMPYGGTDGWRVVGKTPLKDVRLPLGVLRVRAQKPGFIPAEDVMLGGGVPPIKLTTLDATPAAMVRAAPVRGNFSIYIFGLETPRVKFDGFWVDRYETTNRQYKAFVDAGGYRRQEFWRQPFMKDGRTLAFDEAMNLFRDQTGRPGPSTWSLGNYPEAQDDMPVTGVSWYEASAYATFANKSLPTVYHWYWVANQALAGFVVPFGNFNSKGTVPVGDTRAVHRFGTYGLAGNVKEWCFNEAPGNRRYILGGGWDEPPYLFRDADARSPFDRSSNIGFRTVQYDPGDASVAPLSGMLLPPARRYDKEKSVGDDVFAAYRRLYTYDRTELASKIEDVDDTNRDWRIERVSFRAAYGEERIITYLLLPRNVQPPYETILYMPGSGAWDQRTPFSFTNPNFSFLVRSGRAVVFPVYKGSFERANNEYNGGDQLKSTNLWRDYVIFFSKDIGRTLDYLETRSDLQHDKIGFLGFSRGASLSPMMLTAEPRIKVAALWLPGFYLEKIAPEVDAINFAPRVTIPVLQLSGRYDYNFPPDASSEPFFNALGTPIEHKRRVVYDTGHNLPGNESIRETLDWFDQYLGGVR